MSAPEEWKIVNRSPIADCRVFKVSERASRSSNDGKNANFYVLECPDWVNVLPLTDAGEALLIEQYRHGIQEVTLEIPGGMVDQGESPSRTASRELLEETGYQESGLLYLGKSRPNPAIQDNWIHHFAATGCKLTGEPVPDEHESIRTRSIPADKLVSLIGNGEITHSLVISCILLYREYLGRPNEFRYES